MRIAAQRAPEFELISNQYSICRKIFHYLLVNELYIVVRLHHCFAYLLTILSSTRTLSSVIGRTNGKTTFHDLRLIVLTCPSTTSYTSTELGSFVDIPTNGDCSYFCLSAGRAFLHTFINLILPVPKTDSIILASFGKNSISTNAIESSFSRSALLCNNFYVNAKILLRSIFFLTSSDSNIFRHFLSAAPAIIFSVSFSGQCSKGRN